MLEHLLGVEPLGSGKNPVSVPSRMISSASPSMIARATAISQLDRARWHPLEQPEVEERHPRVGGIVIQQHRVARVGVARELAVAVQAAEVEPEQDLADPVALLLRVAS